MHVIINKYNAPHVRVYMNQYVISIYAVHVSEALQLCDELPECLGLQSRLEGQYPRNVAHIISHLHSNFTNLIFFFFCTTSLSIIYAVYKVVATKKNHIIYDTF